MGLVASVRAHVAEAVAAARDAASGKPVPIGEPDFDLIFATVAVEVKARSGKGSGTGEIAATALRHPLLRDAIDARTLARLRADLSAQPRDLRESVRFSLAFGRYARRRGGWRARPSLGDLVRALCDEHPALAAALAGFDLARADARYRAVIDESRVVPLRSLSEVVAPVVEVHAIDDETTTFATLTDVLREDFELGEAAAFFVTQATHLHSSALVATLPQPEAEARIFAATKRARAQGAFLTFRMLRPRT